MTLFKRFDVKSETRTLAIPATFATQSRKSSNSSNSSSPPLQDSDSSGPGTNEMRDEISVPLNPSQENEFARLFALWLIPQIAAKEVEAAWAILSDSEMVLISDAEIQQIKAMPTDTLTEVRLWRDTCLDIIRAAKQRRAV